MCYIYTITSLKKYDIGNGIERLIYVGSCLDYGNRFREHKSRCFNEKSAGYNHKVYRYIRQYGWDNFVFEVIEVMADTTTDEELRIREQFYIDKYDSKSSLNTKDALVDTKKYRREWSKNNRDRHNELRRKYDTKRHMWKRAVKELYNISCFE